MTDAPPAGISRDELAEWWKRARPTNVGGQALHLLTFVNTGDM